MSASDPPVAAGRGPECDRVASGAAPPPNTPRPLAAAFRIGSVEIPNRVVLAPMAGLTTTAYRRHLKTHGAGLVFTEMVSAYGLMHHNVRTGEYLTFAEEERPLAVQLFGRLAGGHGHSGRTGALAAHGARPARHQHGLSGAQGGQDRGGLGPDG